SLLHHQRKNTTDATGNVENFFSITSKVENVDCTTRFVLNQGTSQTILCRSEFVVPQRQTFSLELDLIAPKREAFFFDGFFGSNIEPYDQLIKYYVVDFLKHRRIANDLMGYLHSIEPNIVDIKTAEDTLMFGFKGQRFRKDLNEMGEGFRKVVAIYMALVLSNHHVFFMDELENGLSLHSQKMLWKMLFAFTQRGVRFFISTHQLQTLQTLQEAYHEFCDGSGRGGSNGILPPDCPLEPLALYRLGKHPDTRKVTCTHYGTKKLLLFAEAHAEVRYPHA
ncbi:MAG: AAA family ATPase, partial [Vampirovibrionales bacterium]